MRREFPRRFAWPRFCRSRSFGLNRAGDNTSYDLVDLGELLLHLQADESLKPWEKISAAVGLARYEKGVYRETEEVLRKADEVMYADKMAMKAVRTD